MLRMRVILASKSPRRKEILDMLGVDFEIMTSDKDEVRNTDKPEELVCDIAKQKGRAILPLIDDLRDTLIIACDTLVFAEGEILGKPKDEEDARRMLHLLSNNTHQVISGLYLQYEGKSVSAYESTEVTFDSMTDDEIEKYIESKDPFDKAGAYAVQGRTAAYIKGLKGDYFNVVGLPVNLLYRTLEREFNIKIC